MNEIQVQDKKNANNYQIINMNQYHNNITINKNPIFNNQVGINPRFMNQVAGNTGSLHMNSNEQNISMNLNKPTVNQSPTNQKFNNNTNIVNSKQSNGSISKRTE